MLIPKPRRTLVAVGSHFVMGGSVLMVLRPIGHLPSMSTVT